MRRRAADSGKRAARSLGMNLSASVPMNHTLAFLLLAPLASAAAEAGGGVWRSYEVYQPAIERHFICDPSKQALQYNHCSAIAYFKDRWVALWNANLIPDEAKPGQLIHMSTSRDGKTWAAPEVAFASELRSRNPISCDHVQWQPGLIVVDGALWCFWSQISLKNGQPDEGYGSYFSVLQDPDGKWSNRRLLWDGSPDPVFDQTKFRVFVQGNPTRLSTGRVLVPICLMAKTQVRDSVLYSDDAGQTWRVSAGTMLPDRPKAQWEPTVVEQPGGEVRMIARNTMDPRPTATQILAESIVTATSRDGGKTWSPLETVPAESVSQRPHAMRLDPDQRTPPSENTRFLALHADNRQVLGHGNARDRQPLSLYFNRGGGFEFEAGSTFTGDEAVTHYPQMWRQGDSLLVAYTRGVGLSGIKVAHITPLPEPDRYYLFPRSRAAPDSPRPKLAGRAMRFFPHQSITSRSVARLGTEGFSAVAWLRCDIHGNILDTFDATRSRGFNWAVINGRASFQAPGKGRVQPGHAHMRLAGWSLLGLTVDIKNREVRFFADGKEVGRNPLPSLSASAADGLRATLGGPANGTPGMLGEIRYLALLPSRMDEADHLSFYEAFAQELGRKGIDGAKKPAVDPVLEFDPGEPTQLHDRFDFPSDIKAGLIEKAEDDGRAVLRFHGEIAAGIDLDHHSRRLGDKVSLRFRFRHLTGARYVLGTVGDSRMPVRLVLEDGMIYLYGADTRAACGRLTPGWNTVEIETFGETTSATLNGAPAKEATHQPKGTWVYLGQGYREGTYPVDGAFEIDVSSVSSKVNRPSASPAAGR
jgi:hypothetical protein